MNKTISGKKSILAILLSIIMVINLSGCASTSDQTRTKAEGTGVGAIVGGLLGMAIGHKKGALIGAAVGAGAGFLVGNEIAKRKKKYANEEDFLNGEIKQSASVNRTLYKYNAQLSSEIKQLDKKITVLLAQYKKGTIKKNQLTLEKNKIQKRMKKNKQMLADVKKEYEIDAAVLKEQSKKRKKTDKYVVKLQKEVNALKSNIKVLENKSTQLAKRDERLSV